MPAFPLDVSETGYSYLERPNVVLTSLLDKHVLKSRPEARVLEHIADPVAMLRELSRAEALRDATWVISVPNYAVWYNRVRTLLGRFSYQWSGLFDRTHLRFFTRRSVHELFEYLGFKVVEDRATPALAQSAAPLLRSMFESDLAEGNHLALEESRSYRLYSKAVQPLEIKVCQLWPELLGFQIVSVVRL